MSVLVVGSIALDTVQTPHGKVEDALGGSAVYFSYAASFFGPVRLVGVVGADFPAEFREALARLNIDASGLEVVEGKTFRWSGSYEGSMNSAETNWTELNVFGEFDPKVPDAFRDTPFVFLANGVPAVQKKVLAQVRNPKFVVADTMNLWIDTARDELVELLGLVDAIVLNDEEARSLTGEPNLVRAARRIHAMGPQTVIIKKGEHGSLLVRPDVRFALPAYPAEEVVDPTGAGDSFAGGLMGYLASVGETTAEELKRAMAYGTVVASFNIEDFSCNRFQQVSREHIDQRLAEFRDMLAF